MHLSRSRDSKRPSNPVVKGTPLHDKVICWDLDKTMGQFVTLSGQTSGTRAHIKQVLKILADLGATNVVTTFATKKDTEYAISSAGIKESISRVYSHTDLFLVDGDSLSKDYDVVSADFGVDQSSMVVVGDTFARDMPNNGSVFIYEPDALQYSAHVTRILIETLALAGNGDFRLGFDVLLQQEKIHQTEPPSFKADLFMSKSPVVGVVEFEKTVLDPMKLH